MSLAVVVQVAGGVAVATDSNTFAVSGETWQRGESVATVPKLIDLGAGRMFAGWGAFSVAGDPERNVPAILAKLRGRLESDPPPLEDVARLVGEAIALQFVPLFAGTMEGIGAFIADHSGVVQILVRHDGQQHVRLARPGYGGIWHSPRADRVEELVPQVRPAIAGMSLKDAGRIACELVGEQIVYAAAHPSPKASFRGPVHLTMLSAAGAESHTFPLVMEPAA